MRPHFIFANSIKEARYKSVKLILHNGTIIKDERGEATKELLNLVITIPAEKCELSTDPIAARLQEDFASGLIDDETALRRGSTFEYAYGHEIRELGGSNKTITLLQAEPEFAYSHDMRELSGLNKTIKLLQVAPETRRAYIPMFKAKHIGEEDIPCYVGLDLICRDDTLFLTVFSRSNECTIAMQSDIYGFSQLQRWIAWKIGCDVGTYTQHVVSAHVRLSDMDTIQAVLHGGD